MDHDLYLLRPEGRSIELQYAMRKDGVWFRRWLKVRANGIAAEPSTWEPVPTPDLDIMEKTARKVKLPK